MSGRKEGNTTASCKMRFVESMPAISDHLTDGDVTRTSLMTAFRQDAISAQADKTDVHTQIAAHRSLIL